MGLIQFQTQALSGASMHIADPHYKLRQVRVTRFTLINHRCEYELWIIYLPAELVSFAFQLQLEEI